MNKQTFEILAKWIARQQNVKVVYDSDHGAYATLTNNTIHLPKNIKENNVFAALALLMHESAHLRYSKKIPKNVVTDESEHHILNAIEDIRIDYKNFDRLRNIRGFYEKLIKNHVTLDPSTPLPIKVLVTAILNIEGFHKYGFKDRETRQFLKNSQIEYLMDKAIDNIERSQWEPLKEKIKEIKKILGLESPPKPPQSQPQQNQKDSKNKSKKDKQKLSSQQKKKQKDKNQKDANNLLTGVEKILKPDSVWEKGSMNLQDNTNISNVSLEEQTIKQFKEILNIKEKKIIEDGTILDTENLISFFTGEIDQLFKDDSFTKKKKSKILFLLDESKSMNEFLLDRQSRGRIVKQCTKTIIDILKEVQEIEGINVDYDVAFFNDIYQSVSKEEWEHLYFPKGRTCLYGGFKSALSQIHNDYEVDGKRMIIVLTDGDVDKYQIDEIKELLITNNSDVRCLFIGIGTDPTSKMAEDILGDQIILAESHANSVLLETITQLL